MAKHVVFISHITEERQIAHALKNFIERKFLNSLNVFVSSHEESIKLGDDWLSNIKQSMTDCSLLIILCSPVSIARPWINFEAGAGWVRGIPVIPLCYSGLSPSALPVPLNSFQGGLLNRKDDIRKLFSRIAELNDISSPETEDSEFFDAVLNFENQIQTSILVKDSQFVFNLLLHQVMMLKYCIYASTLSYDAMGQMSDWHTQDVKDHSFTFNDIYHLHNTALIVASLNEKVFELLYKTIHRLAEDVKFILSNRHLQISPALHELLNDFLYQIFLPDVWYSHILVLDRNSKQKSLDDWIVNFIKDEPLPPQKKTSNLINYYIDYYSSLSFYKEWVSNYESLMASLLSRAQSAPQSIA